MDTNSNKFEVISFRVETKSKANDSLGSISSATIKIKVKGEEIHVVSEGNGPVNALDNALRKALSSFSYLERVRVVNYRVRMDNGNNNTASSVRVYITFSDGEKFWTKESVSQDIVNASFRALVEGYDF